LKIGLNEKAKRIAVGMLVTRHHVSGTSYSL
jgi:hypothetical protein